MEEILKIGSIIILAFVTVNGVILYGILSRENTVISETVTKTTENIGLYVDSLTYVTNQNIEILKQKGSIKKTEIIEMLETVNGQAEILRDDHNIILDKLNNVPMAIPPDVPLYLIAIGLGLCLCIEIYTLLK